MNHRPMAYGYRIVLLGITLTGFAQMPIFKRYHIADIPGLGWLAQFYVTHYLHYLFAIALTGLAFYGAFLWILDSRFRRAVTISGYARAGLILGLLATGVFLVVRNLPGRPFAPGVIIAMDILHLMLCIVLLGVSLYALGARKTWTTRPVTAPTPERKE